METTLKPSEPLKEPTTTVRSTTFFPALISTILSTLQPRRRITTQRPYTTIPPATTTPLATTRWTTTTETPTTLPPLTTTRATTTTVKLVATVRPQRQTTVAPSTVNSRTRGRFLDYGTTLNAIPTTVSSGRRRSTTTTAPTTTVTTTTTTTTRKPTTTTTRPTTTTTRATTTTIPTTQATRATTTEVPTTVHNTTPKVFNLKHKQLTEAQKKDLETLRELEREQAAILKQLAFLTSLVSKAFILALKFVI